MNSNRKQYAYWVILVVAAPLAGLLLLMPTADAATRRTGQAGAKAASPYAELAAARTWSETFMALNHLGNHRLGPIPDRLAQKAFRYASANNSSENDCCLVAHLAAVSGNVGLFRLMVKTYFGEAEAEAKGGYVEEFLRYNPRLFFSLPEAWRMWREIGNGSDGGAQECCNEPAKTIPVLLRYAPKYRAARLMLEDVRRAATGREFQGTSWADEARQALHLPPSKATRRDAGAVIGPWKNIYAGDKDLAGIRVQQYPDCDWREQRYSGRHPCMVIYVFKDGRARQLGYRPNGSIEGDFWFRLKPGDCLWETIDRSYAKH